MKKAIFFGVLLVSLTILILSWKNNDKESKGKYLQKNISSYSVRFSDLTRLRNHFNELTGGKFTTQKAWLSVKEMKSMIANLEDDASIEIFFGAYQETDLKRLKARGVLNYTEKKDLKTLILRVPSATGKGHISYDIVQVCPPPDPPNCDPDDPQDDDNQK